jgi:hypothetical protein
MRNVLHSLLYFILILHWPVAACGEELDRLVAAVNGKIITEGDLKLASHLNALVLFGQGGPVSSRQKELNRLIDLELLRQELQNFPVAVGDDKGIQLRMDDLKQGYAEIGGLAVLLRRVGLQEAELESYLRLQASILRFVDLRFRPFVNVDRREIQAYYEQKLAPQLRKKGVQVPGLAEVAAQIEQILKEEKVNLALDEWVQGVRRHSRVDFFDEPSRPEEVNQ